MVDAKIASEGTPAGQDTPAGRRDVADRLCVYALDVGGTKLELGVVDDAGTIRARFKRPTVSEPNGDPFESIVEMFRICREAVLKMGLSPVAVGVGCGGPMSARGVTVSPLNIGKWKSFPLLAELTSVFELPTFIDNDAKALALAEGWLGAARGVENFMAMVVSTGVGGGIVLDGRLLDGRLANAGHVGHVLAVPGGRRCGCGSLGCLEAECSGRAISALTGRPAELASEAVRRRTGRLVGRSVASVACLLDLDLVTIAGSVALGFGEPFFEEAQLAASSAARISFAREIRVLAAGLGADGPLIGAACVALGQLGVRGIPVNRPAIS